MSLVRLPKELLGVKFTYDTAKKKWNLPDNATDEQRKACEKLEKNIERTCRNSVIIKD